MVQPLDMFCLWKGFAFMVVTGVVFASHHELVLSCFVLCSVLTASYFLGVCPIWTPVL